MIEPENQPEVIAVLELLRRQKQAIAKYLWLDQWEDQWRAKLGSLLGAKPESEEWFRAAEGCSALLIRYERFKRSSDPAKVKLPKGGHHLDQEVWEHRVVAVYLRFGAFNGAAAPWTELPVVKPLWTMEDLDVLAERMHWGDVTHDHNRTKVAKKYPLAGDPGPGFLGRAHLLAPLLVGFGPDQFIGSLLHDGRFDESGHLLEGHTGMKIDTTLLKKQLEQLQRNVQIVLSHMKKTTTGS